MGKQFSTVTSLTLLFLLLWPLITTAQNVRDYAITSLAYELIEDDTKVRLTVVVLNTGADATTETDVIVRLLGDNPRRLESYQLEPQVAGAGVTLQIDFDVETFESGSQPVLEVSVGVDNFELANTPIARNNVETITLNIPARSATTQFVWLQREGDTVIVAGETYELYEFALAALGVVGILVVFWIFSIFIRALFTQKTRFVAWQPPYGVTPLYDQNSVEGRRWGWQQVAQNGLLLAPPTDGNIHPLKLLMSSDGITLQNWKVTGMRLSQYDVYGRIARTQVIASNKWVRRMNNILKKRATTDEAKLQKQLRPVADHMVKQFVKNVKKRTAFLPIAFDMRWEGKHGDVRIIFELYQFSDSAWFRIDKWDPIMQVVSQTMQENYTFTIHGKENAEKMKDFRDRLRDDLIWLLLESLRIEALQEDTTGSQPAMRQQYNIPDTLSGMEPVKADDQPQPATTDG